MEDLSQPFHVAMGHQVPGHIVLNDVKRAAVGAADSRLAERHRLQKYEPESFLLLGMAKTLQRRYATQALPGTLPRKWMCSPILELLRHTL